jgi:hypothetical protein
MNRSQTNLALLFLACICIGLLVAVCNRANAQLNTVDTGFFKHVNKQDSSRIYLRFVAVDLPDNETGYVVETYRLRDGKCFFMHNDVRWEENAMVFKASNDKWILNFDIDTETLTVNFPESTSVFYRTEHSPLKFCFAEKRKI